MLAPDGREVAAAPESASEAMVYAALGTSLRHRLAWTGATLADVSPLAAAGARAGQPVADAT